MEIIMETTSQNQKGVPFPIVTLNRAVLTIGVLVALLTQQIWITTMLFLILLPTTLLGKRFSLVYFIGNILIKKNKFKIHSMKMLVFNALIIQSPQPYLVSVKFPF